MTQTNMLASKKPENESVEECKAKKDEPIGFWVMLFVGCIPWIYLIWTLLSQIRK